MTHPVDMVRAARHRAASSCRAPAPPHRRMPVRDWLETRYFDNTLAQWLIAAGVLVGGTIVLLLLRGLVVRRLQRLAQRTKTDIDDLAVDLIRRTRPYFIIAVCLVAGTLALELPA